MDPEEAKLLPGEDAPTESRFWRFRGAIVVISLLAVAGVAGKTTKTTAGAGTIQLDTTTCVDTTALAISGYDVVEYFSLDKDADGVKGSDAYATTYKVTIVFVLTTREVGAWAVARE
jgi:hypothetical protein